MPLSFRHQVRQEDVCGATLNCQKQIQVPLMRETYFYQEHTKIIQKLQNDAGQAKGIKSILSERGKWQESMLLLCRDCSNCCHLFEM